MKFHHKCLFAVDVESVGRSVLLIVENKSRKSEITETDTKHYSI